MLREIGVALETLPERPFLLVLEDLNWADLFTTDIHFPRSRGPRNGEAHNDRHILSGGRAPARYRSRRLFNLFRLSMVPTRPFRSISDTLTRAPTLPERGTSLSYGSR